MLTILLVTLLMVVSVFLILLILIQRGRGGGLAGAFGGMGGQSAFGTKAGDTFTRITSVVAIIWILLCAATVKSISVPSEERTALERELGGGAPADPALTDRNDAPSDAGGGEPGEAPE